MKKKECEASWVLTDAVRAIGREVAECYDELVTRDDKANWNKAGYYREVEILLKHLVPLGQKVLDIGCGNGDNLAKLAPSEGVGLDISPKSVEIATERHKGVNLRFVEGDACDPRTFEAIGEKFDVVIVSGVIHEMGDVQSFLEGVLVCCTPKTRLIILGYSRVWQWPLEIAEKLGLKNRQPLKNWLPPRTLVSLLEACNYQVLSNVRHLILPLTAGRVSRFVNRYIGHLPLVDSLSLVSGFIAKPLGEVLESNSRLQRPCSVVIPCRNESGHIQTLHERLPILPAGSEIIWIEGNSTDDTEERLKELVENHPDKPYVFMKQPGKGKGDAVRAAMAQAKGDIVLILDADITVPPEDLWKFLGLLESGRAEFVNGTRLVYPMHKNAMRFLNLLGNRFFAMVFSWLLRQYVTDTLCGTKVMWREDYNRLDANRSYFGDIDPFGDFDLLLGAARMHLKIRDLPIRYDERTYGDTNISRFSHGWLLLKMTYSAARKIYFI